MIDSEEIHQGGYYKLMRVLSSAASAPSRTSRPYCHLDLDHALALQVSATGKSPGDCPKYSAEAKWVELEAEFDGQSYLFLVHAMLVAVSRRRDPPPEALPLFFRIWRDKGSELARTLPVRWLISAATTFADCGETGDQRALGMGLSTLFDLIKLHESERRITGQPGNKPFRRATDIRRPAMPFRMKPDSLKGGDLDRVMLSRLWQLSERDATIRPLAMRMLRMVMTDQRTIFGRVEKFENREGA